MHSCEPDPDPRVSSIFSVVMNHKKWPTNRWGLVCDNTQPVDDYTCVHLHPLGWSRGMRACAPHLLLVAVFEGGEVCQELHTQTAPLLSLFVPASTTGGKRRAGHGAEGTAGKEVRKGRICYTNHFWPQ